MYLDFSASTPISPTVSSTLRNVIQYYGNPSSLHDEGQKAKKLIMTSSDIIAKCLNCDSEEIYYTPGATYSNNLAIQGFLKKNKRSVLLYSAIEHEDIMLLAKEVNSFSVNVHEDGCVDMQHLHSLLKINVQKEKMCLVSIQAANGEMGTVQNIEMISDIVHSYPNCYLHMDCTQYIPYNKIDLQKLNIDMLSMSGQKIGCIKGIGLLYIKKGTPISPIIYGQQGLIGGTENVPGIACLGEAFRILNYDQSKIRALAHKRDFLYEGLQDLGQLVGIPTNMMERLPNNLNMIFDGINGEELVVLLSGFGVYVSSGSACSSNTDEPSHVLLAMGYTPEQANSSIRFSICEETSYEELDKCIKITRNCVKMLLDK